LLSNDDATLYHREEIEQSSFNGTVFTNSTSGENFTSYWHLPADAPLLEQPGVDTLQSPVPIKHSHDFRLKAGPSLRSCTRLQVLPLRPLYEFIAFHLADAPMQQALEKSDTASKGGLRC
uniref:Glyco_hydro_38C domain-containing protein n=1 Tax=Taenia asiatica TaxID=60517 RepID=A0A0R3WCF9_TAEAS